MSLVDQSKRTAEGLGGRKTCESIRSKTMADLELEKNLKMSVMPGYDRKISQISAQPTLRPSQANLGILGLSQKRD
jgi:hypothetical protein